MLESAYEFLLGGSDWNPKNCSEGEAMRCPVCSRYTGWMRTRCPACRTKLIQWYVIAGILILMACYGGLVILENVG